MHNFENHSTSSQHTVSTKHVHTMFQRRWSTSPRARTQCDVSSYARLSNSFVQISSIMLLDTPSQLFPAMRNLRLVPSDGLRAGKASSSCDYNESSSVDFSGRTSDEPNCKAEKQQAFHQSWVGTQLGVDSPQPFVATIEPKDTTLEEREHKILCQKVLMLAAQLFPDAACSQDLQVEHIGAGSFHDVIGFAVPTLQPIPSKWRDESHFTIVEEKYVTRIPRTNHSDQQDTNMRRDIAVLQGLEGRLKIPIPQIIAFNLDDMNVLNAAPCTIETRLRGRSLLELVGDGMTLEGHNHFFVQAGREARRGPGGSDGTPSGSHCRAFCGWCRWKVVQDPFEAFRLPFRHQLSHYGGQRWYAIDIYAGAGGSLDQL